MKQLILLLLTIGLLSSCLPEQYTYCGKVTDKYRAYEGRIKSVCHIVFFNDNLNRNIDIRVSDNDYVNTTINQRVCYDLTKEQTE